MDFRENNATDSRGQSDPYLPSAFTSGETSVSSVTLDCDSTSLFNSWEKPPKFKTGVQGVQRIEDSIFVIDMTMLSKKEQESLRKIVKSSIKDQGKAAKGEKRNRKEEVAEFLKQYKDGNFCDVAVAQLRHMIPLLLMEVYEGTYGQYSAKVKGLWEKRPDGWDEDVPFLDPNNNIKVDGKRGSKPIKEDLMLMLNFLVTKYKQMSVDEKRTCPHQVEDTEEDDHDSKQNELLKDPVRALVNRIESRLRILATFPWAASYTPGLQTNLDSIRTSECLMAYGHILEYFVDCLTLRETLSPNWHDQLTNMQNILGKLETTSQYQTADAKSEAWTSGSGCRASAKSVNANSATSESMQDFIPKMNIKARGDADPMLVSDVAWREDFVFTENSTDEGCCGMQKCHDLTCDDDNPYVEMDLLEIVGNPEYHSDTLLSVLDQIASGEQEVQQALDPLVASGEPVNNTLVVSRTTGQNFNFQESELNSVDLSAIEFANSAHPTTSAIPFHHIPHVPVTNSSPVEFPYPVSQISADFEQEDVWKHVLNDGKESTPLIDQSPLTGTFEQLTLRNDENPTVACPLNEISGFETALVPSPINMFIINPISLNSTAQIPATPPIAGKRVAPIPVMVETADDFEEPTFSAPSTKRSRQSNARR